MRVVADENIARIVVARLRKLGFEVLWIAETHPGWPDEKVADLCLREKAMLSTFDKALASRLAIREGGGVVLLRLIDASPEVVASRVEQLLTVDSSAERTFSILDDNGLRQRPLGPRSGRGS